MGLTPYEIMFGTSPPIIPNLQSNLIAEMDDWDLLDTMQSVEWVHKEIWPI